MADKNKSTTDKLKDVGFLGELWQQIRLVFYLVKDRDVPIYLKVLPFLGILYTLFPIDLITDVVPVLGQLDDLTVLLIGAKVFIEMAPQQVVARYVAQMRGEPSATIVEGTATDVGDADLAPNVKLIEGEIVDASASDVAATSDVASSSDDPAEKRRWFRR